MAQSASFHWPSGRTTAQSSSVRSPTQVTKIPARRSAACCSARPPPSLCTRGSRRRVPSVSQNRPRQRRVHKVVGADPALAVGTDEVGLAVAGDHSEIQIGVDAGVRASATTELGEEQVAGALTPGRSLRARSQPCMRGRALHVTTPFRSHRSWPLSGSTHCPRTAVGLRAGGPRRRAAAPASGGCQRRAGTGVPVKARARRRDRPLTPSSPGPLRARPRRQQDRWVQGGLPASRRSRRCSDVTRPRGLVALQADGRRRPSRPKSSSSTGLSAQNEARQEWQSAKRKRIDSPCLLRRHGWLVRSCPPRSVCRPNGSRAID